MHIVGRTYVLTLITCSVLLGGCPNGAGISCPTGALDCLTTCVDARNDPNNCGGCGLHCTSTQVCVNGACSEGCGPNLIRCGNLCVDSQSDPGNCGGCGMQCGADTYCVAGQCSFSCPAPNQLCSGPTCIDTANDSKNCGACGNVCPLRQVCCGGSCVVTNTNDHCGGCGACPANTSCLDLMFEGFECVGSM
jgi:Stigma-specific protein, Stig1